MARLRILGLALVAWGAVGLLLLATPWRHLALEWSVARLVSLTDVRIGNEIDGGVDVPVAVAGSAAVLFAGLWFALYVPRVIARARGASRDG